MDPDKAMQEVLRQKPPQLKRDEIWSGRFQDFLKEVSCSSRYRLAWFQ